MTAGRTFPTSGSCARRWSTWHHSSLEQSCNSPWRCHFLFFRERSRCFSRNPIYLAFSLFQLGVAIWVDSLWLLATLVGAVALMHFVVIPKEESYLERRFGAQYLEYKASVRRWL